MNERAQASATIDRLELKSLLLLYMSQASLLPSDFQSSPLKNEDAHSSFSMELL